MSLLISICNQNATPYQSLLLLNDENNAQWVELPTQSDFSLIGCIGIEKVGSLTYVLTQGEISYLLIYDANFIVVSLTKVPEILDAHSLCYHDGYLYIVSSGNNSIYRLPLSSIGFPFPDGNVEFFWRYPGIPSVDEDLVHLNSIAVNNGQLHVTCFGLKTDTATWKTATNGLCMDISENDTKKIESLYHPHSAKFEGETLFVCASNTHDLIRLEEADGVYEIKSRNAFDGYIRGFTFSDKYYYVGQSESRKVSRSRGTENLLDGKICQNSKVYILDKDNLQIVKEIDISPFGAEIYDLCYIDDLPFVLEDTAKNVRIATLETGLTTRLAEAARLNSRLNAVKNESSEAIARVTEELKLARKEVSEAMSQLAEETTRSEQLRTEIENALQQKIVELKDMAAKLGQVAEDLAERDERIRQIEEEAALEGQQMEQRANEQAAELSRLTEEIAARDKVLGELDRHIADKAAAIDRLGALLQEKDRELADREQEKKLMGERAADERLRLQKEIEARDRRIEEHAAAIGHLNGEVALERQRLEEQLARLNDQLQGSERQLQQQVGVIRAQEDQLQANADELGVLREELTTLREEWTAEKQSYEQQLLEKNELIQNFLNSKSWKITTPLRAAQGLFKKE